MLDKLSKGFPYGTIIFLIMAFITHAITSPDWYQANQIVVHAIPLILSLAFGFAACSMFGYYLTSSVGSGLEPILKSIFLYPLWMGVVVFCVCLGGGAFTLMSAPDYAVFSFYCVAFSASMIAAMITFAVNVSRLARKDHHRTS